MAYPHDAPDLAQLLAGTLSNLPRAYTKLHELTSKMERLFRERHWIDARTVTRLRPVAPTQACRAYPIPILAKEKVL